jgi:hypothetical protein
MGDVAMSLTIMASTPPLSALYVIQRALGSLSPGGWKMNGAPF